MSQRDKQQTATPRTDFCEDCDEEIHPEVTRVEGRDDLIHGARNADNGFESVVAGKVEVTFSCACSHVTVEYGPGSASAWDFPESWMWPDVHDVSEEVLEYAD